MKKGCRRMLAVLAALALTIQSAALATSGGLLNFQKSINYTDGIFSDIDSSDWFYQDVVNSYQYGLSSGVGEGLFEPDGPVSLAQAITYAARVRSIYRGETIPAAEAGQAWYVPYVDYARKQGIADEGMASGWLEGTATRVQVGALFAAALPADEYQVKNPQITGVPDMSEDDPYYGQVLSLYRSGVVKGTDNYGNFQPEQAITRAEAAAILNRVVEPDSRLTYTLLIGNMNLSDTSLTLKPGESYQMRAEPASGLINGGSFSWKSDNDSVATVSEDGIVTAVSEGRALIWTADANGEKNSSACNVEVRLAEGMDAEQIAAAAGPAVFLLELYGQNGQKIATGSGFFIENSGIAATNYHVIEDAYRAVATLTDGSQHEVELVLGYDKNRDVAIIKVKGDGFPALALADSDSLRNGQRIYCLGSPLGMDNSISEGLISNTSRMVNGQTYIQISAPISPGSSGGAVLDDSCRVVGISTGSLANGQLINMAVPANVISEVERGNGITLAKLSADNAASDTAIGYAENAKIPDYGAVTGAETITKGGPDESGVMGYAYGYKENELSAYIQFLTQTGFVLVDQTSDENAKAYLYQNGRQFVEISIQFAENQIWVFFNV